jgi:cytochrome c553
MKIKTTLLLLAIAMFYATCKSVVYNPDICFQENILPIFVTNCSMSGCHDATSHKKGYDLSTYDGIMKGITANHPLQSEIYNSITGGNPSMPPKGKMNATDIGMIKTWIKMGAPNSSNCSGCDTTLYSYSGKIQPLMTTWCVGCHNASNTGGGYDLSSYAGVVTAITDTRLLGTINHSAGFSAMPKNTSKLSDCDVNAVVKWVNAGYPNN